MSPNSPHIINVPCRYYRVYTDPGVPCIERNFRFVERTLPIPLEKAALILVDVWSTHYIDSWLRRAQDIVHTRIAPLLQAARSTGLTVVHAPAPYIIERHYRHALPQENTPSSSDPDWPPPAFRGIYRSGEHGAFGRDQEAFNEIYARYEVEMDIAEPARPAEGDFIITTGAQLHSLLAKKRILHLFYAGFAANWCIIGRDYGIIAMNERGYNIVLIRDATTGIEFHDTVDNLTATEMTVREIETKYAWSTTTESLLEACKTVKDD